MRNASDLVGNEGGREEEGIEQFENENSRNSRGREQFENSQCN